MSSNNMDINANQGSSLDKIKNSNDSPKSDRCIEARRNRIMKTNKSLVPRIPFCKEYDGMDFRRNTTISKSIIELIESQQDALDSKGNDCKVEYKSTMYFDQLKDVQDMIKTSSNPHIFVDKHGQNGGSISGESYSSSSRNTTETESRSEEDFLQNCENEASGWYSMTRPNYYNDASSTSSDVFSLCNYRNDEDIGTIDLNIKYDARLGQLKVHILEAEDIRHPTCEEKLMDTFVKVSICKRRNESKQRTRVVRKSRDPVFDHVLNIDDVKEAWLHLECLRVELFEKKRFRKHCIGECLIWLDDLDLLCKTEVKLTEQLRSPYI